MDIHRVEWLKRDWCKPSIVSAMLMTATRFSQSKGIKVNNTMRLISSIGRCASASHGALRVRKAQGRYVFWCSRCHTLVDLLKLFSAKHELEAAVTNN